jgi:hypothetical protein
LYSLWGVYRIKHHAKKTYYVAEVKLHAFSAFALDGGEWLASVYGRLALKKGLSITVKQEVDTTESNVAYSLF